MILCLRDWRGFPPQLRLGIVASLVLALLVFPCSPFAKALGPGVGHAHAAAPAHTEQGEGECAHGTKKHEKSCCNECTSWLTKRIDNGTAAVGSQASPRDLLAVTPAFPPAVYVGTDQEQRLTGPPQTGFLDGTNIYSRTKRYRI